MTADASLAFDRFDKDSIERIDRAVRSMVENKPTLDDWMIALNVRGDIDAHDVDVVVCAYLRGLAARHRRSIAAAIEAAAQRAAEEERWAADPRSAPVWSAPYKAWIKTSEGASHEAERVRVARSLREESREQNRVAREHKAEREALVADGVAKYGSLDAFHHAELQRIVDAYTTEVEIRVTRELLASEFALGDGRRVTWGRATFADHRERIEMLDRQVLGVAKTASRHRAAMQMLETAGVACLAEHPDALVL